MNDKLIIYLVLAVSVLFVILIVTIPPSASSSNSMQIVPLQNVNQPPQPLYHPQSISHPSKHQPRLPPQNPQQQPPQNPQQRPPQQQPPQNPQQQPPQQQPPQNPQQQPPQNPQQQPPQNPQQNPQHPQNPQQNPQQQPQQPPQNPQQQPPQNPQQQPPQNPRHPHPRRPQQPLKESYKALEIKTAFNKKVEPEVQTDQSAAPQMTLKYEKINQVPHNDIETIIANDNKEDVQMELVNEMKDIPVAPEALEGPEIICEKGICVRKRSNPFGTIITANDIPSAYVMIEQVKSRYVKPTSINESNPFNL